MTSETTLSYERQNIKRRMENMVERIDKMIADLMGLCKVLLFNENYRLAEAVANTIVTLSYAKELIMVVKEEI